MKFNEPPKQLFAIREQLEKGETVIPVKVSDFLSWFGFKRRGSKEIYEITIALVLTKLTTIPDYSSVNLNSEILIALDPIQFENKKNEITKKVIISLNSEKIDPSYKISRIISPEKNIISVKPDSDISEAITKMIGHDYSQLPVMQQPKRGLKGIVSWKSIGKMLANNLDIFSLKVKDVMDKEVKVINDEKSFFEAIPEIINHEFVLIKNHSDEIYGIITTTDLSVQFNHLTKPFLLISEIERKIRILLSSLDKSHFETLKSTEPINRNIENIYDLTFGDYIRLIERPQIWDSMKLKVNRKLFCELLNKVRVIRNKIMHFDPDGLVEGDFETINNFYRILINMTK